MADDDWNDLGAVWQEKDSDIDVAALTKNMQRKTRRMQMWFFLEVVFCLIGIGLGVSWFFGWGQQDALPEAGFAISVFSAVGLYIACWARKGAWRIVSGTPVDELKTARFRAQAGVRYAVANLWFILPSILMAAYLLWIGWEASDKGPLEEARLIRVAVIVPIFLLIALLWSLWYKRKKTRELAALDKVISEMEEE